MPSAFILRFARKRLQDLADWARACAETLDAAFQEKGEILVQTQLDHGGGVDDGDDWAAIRATYRHARLLAERTDDTERMMQLDAAWKAAKAAHDCGQIS